MNRVPRCVTCILLLSLSATPFTAQTRTSLNAAPEPFSIKPGSTFSASGSGAGVTNAGVNRLSSDIAEAESLIRQNSVVSPHVTNADMTKSVLTGALRSLDPHSNYFDP